METALKRERLKRNFLKQIIMRLDFQGVLQNEMEKVLVEVKPLLKEAGYNRYDEKVNNQAVFNGATVVESSSQIVYSFINENEGFTLELSTTAIILLINSSVYVPFEKYAKVFTRVAGIYKEKIDFFTVKRFGFRKINFCFFKELESITRYFKSDYYATKNPVSGFDIASVDRTSRLSDGKKNVNLRYLIEQGEIDMDPYYKVTLDSDVYSLDRETITCILDEESELSSINDLLFEVYCGSITEDFLSLLTDEDKALPEGLVGVEDNE